MPIVIPDVLDAAEVARVRDIIDAGAWVPGNAASGPQAAPAAYDEHLAEDSAAARDAGVMILDALGRTALFVAAALPLKVFPPLFSRYAGGQDVGLHVADAIRIKRGTDFRIRCDLSATLFLADPDSYDGGELVVADQFGEQRVKLPAGHMALYPTSSPHRVEAVTRGSRVTSVFWLQSMVRDDGARRILFELDQGVQSTAEQLGQGAPEVVRLTGVYHNLLRRWADA